MSVLMRVAAGLSGVAPVTFVSSASTHDGVQNSTLVIAKPTGTILGDLMVSIIFRGGNAITWTGDTGWTEIADQGIDPNLRVAYKVASGSEGSSYTFTNTGGGGGAPRNAGSILTFRNAAYATIGAITTDANPLVISGVSASVPRCLLIGVAARGASGLTITAPAGMTTQVTDSGEAISYTIATETLTASGTTGTRTFSGLAGGAGAGVLLTLKPA